VKRVPRRAIAWAVAVAAALVLSSLCGRLLAERDIVSAVLSAREPQLVLAALALVLCRLFLYLLAPGWALYIALRTLLERRAGRVTAPGSSPRGG
jgi:hypothetical protein